MSLPLVTSTPQSPDAERLYNGRPAFGADAMRLLAVLGHLAGYRHRRQAVYIIEGDASAAEVYGKLPPGPTSQTHHLAFACSPLCRYLAVRVDCQADDESTTKPIIEVTAYQVAGSPPAAIDTGFRWAFDDGTLPTERHVGLEGFVGPLVFEHAVLTVHTPNAVPSEAELAAAPSGPRLLDVSSEVYGTGGLVDVIVDTTEARVVSVTIEEVPEESF